MKNTHSEIKISPKNWEKNLKSNLKKEWYGYYYFYSPQFPNGKMIKFKGMNRCNTLEEKQQLTRYLIQQELNFLNAGYNPITKEYENSDNFISERTPFIQALEIAKTKIKVSEATITDIEYSMKHIKAVAVKTGISILGIGEVRKRDIRQLLGPKTKNEKSKKVKQSVYIRTAFLIAFSMMIKGSPLTTALIANEIKKQWFYAP